jgi:hypothetical protein
MKRANKAGLRAAGCQPVVPSPSPAVTCDLKVDLENHQVGIFFGSPVACMVWTPEQADAVGRGLIEHAKAARGHLQ